MAKNKKTKKSKKKVPTKKKRIYEFFKIIKKGKEKVVKTKGVEKTEVGTKKQIEHQNKLLRNMFMGVGLVILIIIGFFLTSNYMNHFEHRGVEFKIIKEGDLVFYNTVMPLYLQGTHVADYNFYIRNDPRKLGNVSFEGDFVLAQGPLVISSDEEFFCDGDGIIAMANFAKPLELLNIQTITDENATCDPLGRYTLIRISSGNETKIEDQGYSDTACYNMYVNNCEILKATERFMLELFVKFNEGS